MTEPTAKTMIVETLFTCESCGCIWPDVVIQGSLSLIECPRTSQEGHPQHSRIYVGGREAFVAFVEPSNPVELA